METNFLLKKPCKVCGDNRRYLKRITCVTCARRRANERRARDPLRKRAEGKRWRLLNQNKINEYNRLWRERNKTTLDYRLRRRKHRGYPDPSRPEPAECEMCGKPPNAKQSMYLDHCHRTNIFRGWLCGKCNTGLGMLGDDIDVAIERLQRYKQKL